MVVCSHHLKKIFLSVSLVAFVVSSCFGGGKPPGSIVGYKNGLVMMRKGSYRVGEVPASWHQVEFKYKSLAFREPSSDVTIATNSFCGQNYDDAPLEVLTRHLYMGISDVKVESQSEAMLDGRRSLRTVWRGKMDGVSVKLETVSVQKNNCLFDFYYVAFPDDFAAHRDVFVHFVEGFSYP